MYQRLEAAIIFLATIYFYIHLHYNLLLFVLLVLAIDVFAVGYASKNSKIGAHVYNVGHSLIVPPVMLVLGVALSNSILIGGGLIWIAHIAMDRMLGYGLKYETDFKNTHLGRIGKNRTSKS